MLYQEFRASLGSITSHVAPMQAALHFSVAPQSLFEEYLARGEISRHTNRRKTFLWLQSEKESIDDQ